MATTESILEGDVLFKYDQPRITKGNIRLLQFNERQQLGGRSSKSLSLVLSRSSLPSEPGDPTIRYLALSYVWGKPDDEHPVAQILVNNRHFQVGYNLERVLTHLEGKLDLPIWIDAICINQEDLDEKKEQVDQMRVIYKGAVRTIIWLGEGDQSTAQVMARLNNIGKDAIDAGIDKLDYKDWKQWPNFTDEDKVKIKDGLLALIPKMARGFPMREFINLSNEPWFKRVWVVQELSVSSHYTFTCRDNTVPGEHFIAGFRFICVWIMNEIRPLAQRGSLFWLPVRLGSFWWRNGWSWMSFLLGLLQNKPIMPNPRAASTLGSRKRWIKDSPTLKSQLCQAFILSSGTNAESLDATDPRDRIYAFLGIASDYETLGIFSDYKKTTTELYTDIARKLIQSGHLDILTLCRSASSESPRDANLPSWAPDWEKKILFPWGGYIEDDLFHASGKYQPTPEALSDETLKSGNTLTLNALFIGRLGEVGTRWNSSWNENFNYDKVRLLFNELLGFLEKSSAFDQPAVRANAFWRIPIGDKEMGALGMAQRATEKSFKEWQDMIAILSQTQSPYKMANIVSYQSAMKDMHNSRPFLSDNSFGGYVGLCPDSSVGGDDIFIPVGSHVPIILRDAGDGFYQVVGEAYVQGLMDGEALGLGLESREVRLI